MQRTGHFHLQFCILLNGFIIRKEGRQRGKVFEFPSFLCIGMHTIRDKQVLDGSDLLQCSHVMESLFEERLCERHHDDLRSALSYTEFAHAMAILFIRLFSVILTIFIVLFSPKISNELSSLHQHQKWLHAGKEKGRIMCKDAGGSTNNNNNHVLVFVIMMIMRNWKLDPHQLVCGTRGVKVFSTFNGQNLQWCNKNYKWRLRQRPAFFLLHSMT